MTRGRRGPRPYVPMTLSVLLSTPAEHVRLRDMAAVTGFSRQKMWLEVRRGSLSVAWVKCGTRRIVRVPIAEARRYVMEIGVGGLH